MCKSFQPCEGHENIYGLTWRVWTDVCRSLAFFAFPSALVYNPMEF
ncbi:predicted protein [Botrytis cinerea T4]|uniref:Uncharacterized protein n=1 Tax=Botryotinia fuckeliana (strain T4) TaxID=999810 RepID=G2YAC7_BOTF4|nr:predicted protein [Botrytis cinerea T4]